MLHPAFFLTSYVFLFVSPSFLPFSILPFHLLFFLYSSLRTFVPSHIFLSNLLFYPYFFVNFLPTSITSLFSVYIFTYSLFIGFLHSSYISFSLIPFSFSTLNQSLYILSKTVLFFCLPSTLLHVYPVYSFVFPLLSSLRFLRAFYTFFILPNLFFLPSSFLLFSLPSVLPFVFPFSFPPFLLKWRVTCK